ncbi:MAG: ribonuclease III [Prosthecobacter sp.]|nr:ribonuclease III [Prosthecobacter sp.]
MELLELILGYTFRDRQTLVEALTHPSLGYESQRSQPDNQRLEFLGDAVLQPALSEMLYRKFSEADEGVLTKTRAQLVSAKALAAVARRLKLGGYLLMGRGEDQSGGRERDSSLADVLEAIAGAIYLDGGMAAATDFVDRLFSAVLEDIVSVPAEQNPKGHLQELLQSAGDQPPTYSIVQESGPDHAKSFEATVNWQGTTLGRGLGKSKKEAEVEAARCALASADLAACLQSFGCLNYKSTEISGMACEQASPKVAQS